MLTVASSEGPCPGRSQPAGIETVGSSADVAVVGSGSAPDSRSPSGGCPASALDVRAGVSAVAVDGASVAVSGGASVVAADVDSGASGCGVSAAEVGAASVAEENGASDASGWDASGARADGASGSSGDGASEATGDGDSASGADAALDGADGPAVENASLAGGVIGRPVGGVGVSSDRSDDGAAGVADGAKVTVSAGASAAAPPRAIVGTGPGSAAAAAPDRRTAPSNGSGASQSTPAGGSCRTADAGRPCQTYCSASTPP